METRWQLSALITLQTESKYKAKSNTDTGLCICLGFFVVFQKVGRRLFYTLVVLVRGQLRFKNATE